MDKKIKRKLPRKLIAYPDGLRAKVQDIMRDRLLRNEIMAIEYAIVETHRKLNPSYVRAMAPMAPEDKIRRQEELEKAKINAKRDRLRNVCETIMGGTLDEDSNGHFTCDVTQYQYLTPKRIVKGKTVVDENEIETFQRYQYLGFPENISDEERAELIARAEEV